MGREQAKESNGKGVKTSFVRPDVFRQLQEAGSLAATLNLKPTLWFAGPVTLFFLFVSTFLEVFVVNAATTVHLAVFAVGSYIVFSSYFVCDYQMKKQSTSYAAIPDDKKFYVLSNLIKSAVLLSYCPNAIHVLYMALGHDVWDNGRIRNLGVLYAIPDFVSLFLVSRMSITTKLHHVTVVIFMICNLYTDYSELSVSRAIVIYGVFSTFAYLVNLLLASRFLKIGPIASLCMSLVAFLVYTFCLLINWTWQTRFLWNLWWTKPSYAIYIYISCISMVVYDDAVLVKWLWGNVLHQTVLSRESASPPTKNT